VDVANTLHRIDPGFIRSDPSVRGKTGRVVMKFIKPAS
jgi:predicted methyltransferase